MMRRRKDLIIYFFFSIFICCSESGSGQSNAKDSVTVYPFGKVFLYTPETDKAKNIIIMISGDGGWKFGVPAFAKEFSRMNSVVAGVDILQYYRHLRQLNSDCFLVSSDFVELATAVERKYNFTGYIPPVIMGYSSGATLVYGILSQARPGTFTGGISLGFCPDIELPKMLCQINGLEENELVKDKSYLFLPDEKLGNPWIVLQGKSDKVCSFKVTEEFVLKTGNARLIALQDVGHGFSKWSDFMPQWKKAYSDLINRFYDDQSTPAQSPGLSNIPARIIKGKEITGIKMIAVLLSGDGGWYGFEQSISDHLGDYGIPVLGIDTKKYFWNRKSPEKTASELADLMRSYGRDWNKSEYMLIGYSQGAEIVPFIFNRLPDDIRLKVKSVVMLSPETTTDFEVHISNMIGLGNKLNTYNVIPEIIRNKESRQIIIFGENEKTSVPELLKGTKVEIVKIPGDHHYKSNTTLIFQKMKENNAF